MRRLGVSEPPNDWAYEVYDRALTHSSFTYENKLSHLDNYERLEFLGDAVLKLLTSEYLFERFPNYREGPMTKIRAVVVSDNALAKFALELDLGPYMTFGKSELRNNGRKKPSNLACGFESLLGALFIDEKLDDARTLLFRLLEDEVTRVDLDPTKDNFKATLQEITQADGGELPLYQTVKETGPAHKRTFIIDVLLHNEVLGQGKGASKKEAQQSAAKMALIALGELEND